jgi:hypothetical protein
LAEESRGTTNREALLSFRRLFFRRILSVVPAFIFSDGRIRKGRLPFRPSIASTRADAAFNLNILNKLF